MLRVMKIDLRSTGYKVIGAMPFLYTMKLQLLYNIYPAYMKIVFAICLFIFSQQVFSRTLIIGTLWGSIIRNDMSGLKPGDTLAIRSGFYENVGSFSSLTGITIINYQASLILGELYRWEILNRFLFQDRAGKEKPMELVAAGILIDTIECKLNPSGAAIDHRLTFSFIPTDIEGIHRPMGKSSDIDAREFPA